MNTYSLTVLFEEPFWIGLFENTDQKGLCACKVTFGAEPTEKEVMEFVDKNWNQLQFSQAIEVSSESERKAKVNPKRQLREAKKQMLSQGIGTKSQQALKLQQEQNKIERKQRSKAEREAEKQRQFDLRQAKKKEKHKGH
jgi:hypothetical protein